MTRLITIGTTVLLAVIAIAGGVASALAASRTQRPPGCVQATITAGIHVYHGEFCGEGSGAVSPLRRERDGWSLTIDGANGLGNGFVILGTPR